MTRAFGHIICVSVARPVRSGIPEANLEASSDTEPFGASLVGPSRTQAHAPVKKVRFHAKIMRGIEPSVSGGASFPGRRQSVCQPGALVADTLAGRDPRIGSQSASRKTGVINL